MYLLRGSRAGKQTRRVSRLLMDDVIRLDKFIAQHKAIAKYRIETSDDMIARCTDIKARIQTLTDRRKEIRHEPENRKQRFPKSPTGFESYAVTCARLQPWNRPHRVYRNNCGRSTNRKRG